MSVEDEIPLSGGNVNARVVRIGNTVRRNLTATSPTAHRLLLHLEAKGFKGSPRFLGIDEKHREVTTFIEGATGIPATIWQHDTAVIAAANLLRQYHDATVDFVPTNETAWAYVYPDTAKHEVLCHNDFAPYNFIYTTDVPIAVVDFDLAGPGPRLRDVAYAVYWMTPMSFNSGDQIAFAEADMKAGSRRLKLFCAVYGLSPDTKLLDMIDEVLAFMGDEEKMRQVVGVTAAAKLKQEGHLEHWQRERASYQRQRANLAANLYAD
ncbi:MAG: aminoglycoside phosphotransferase family protein [Caldilineaceae bacterium]